MTLGLIYLGIGALFAGVACAYDQNKDGAEAGAIILVWPAFALFAAGMLVMGLFVALGTVVRWVARRGWRAA